MPINTHLKMWSIEFQPSLLISISRSTLSCIIRFRPNIIQHFLKVTFLKKIYCCLVLFKFDPFGSVCYWIIFIQFWHSASAYDVRACASTGDSLCVVHTRTKLLRTTYMSESYETADWLALIQQLIVNKWPQITLAVIFLVFLCKWAINSTWIK